MSSRNAYNVRLNASASMQIGKLAEQFQVPMSRVLELYLLDTINHPPQLPGNAEVPPPFGTKAYSLSSEVWTKYHDVIKPIFNGRLLISYLICDATVTARVRDVLSVQIQPADIALSPFHAEWAKILMEQDNKPSFSKWCTDVIVDYIDANSAR